MQPAQTASGQQVERAAQSSSRHRKRGIGARAPERGEAHRDKWDTLGFGNGGRMLHRQNACDDQVRALGELQYFAVRLLQMDVRDLREAGHELFRVAGREQGLPLGGLKKCL
jgi:hypothetical protein